MLAKKDFKRVLEYDLNSHGLAEGLSGDIILPDLLRMKGQALIALDRIDEAREALVKAQEIAEVCGSRFTVHFMACSLRVEPSYGNRRPAGR